VHDTLSRAGKITLNQEIISTASIDFGVSVSPDPELESERRHLQVPMALHGVRIDKCLAELMPEFSRSYVQQLMHQGDVCLDDKVLSKPAAKVRFGQQLWVTLNPTDQAQSFKAENIFLSIVHEDDDLLVLNKPAGLVVHPAAGNWSGTLMNGLLHHHAGAFDLPRAGIVHRLDKDTSGLMLVGKTRLSMEALTRMIAKREVHRFYLAIAEKVWLREGTVTVDKPLGRDPGNRLRMAVLPPEASNAKLARTQFRALDRKDSLVLLGCKLFTGRTHQIRVHLSHLGHPILGDLIYGGHLQHGITRQSLHATRLDFVHPVSGKPMSFTIPLPQDMATVLDSQGLNYNDASLGPDFFAHSN
jgi:23S rRNA pseudouridine1911/1915/1917 synthase